MTDHRDHPKSDRDYHNRVAADYDGLYVEPLQYQLLNAQFVEEIASVFAPDEGLLLELGAGTGALAVPLHRRGYDVLAADHSERMLRKLTSKCPEIRTLVADVTAPLPLEPSSVGCVVISQALHHIPHQETIFREASRLLRPGGKLCIFEPQVLPSGLDFLRRLAQRVCSTGDHVASERPVHPRKLKQLLRSHGFRPLRSGTTFFLPFNPRSPSARWLVRAVWTVPGRAPLLRRLGGVVMIFSEKV